MTRLKSCTFLQNLNIFLNSFASHHDINQLKFKSDLKTGLGRK